jgi:hypothetical protein
MRQRFPRAVHQIPPEHFRQLCNKQTYKMSRMDRLSKQM